MPIDFEPEFEPEKTTKSFKPEFEPEFEPEKQSMSQASYSNEGYRQDKGGRIPGEQYYTPKEIEEKNKKPEKKLSVLDKMERVINPLARVPELTDIIKPLVAGAASYPAALVMGPIQSGIDLYQGKPTDLIANMETVGANVAGLAGEPQTEFGEDANKFLQENVYRHLPAMGATGFHVSPAAKQQRIAANFREGKAQIAKFEKGYNGPDIPREQKATNIGPQPPADIVAAKQAAETGPIQPESAKNKFVGPDKQLAELADVEALRSIIGDDAVDALRARVAADNEMRQQNLTQLEELSKADEARAAQERPNQTSLETPEGQQTLFDQADLMGQRNQFNAGDLGDWRIDENGMPVRVDKSMEAANLGEPLQRGMWGDELGPALGNDRSLTEAIDSLPAGAHRDMALERLQGAVDAPPELQRAMMEAEGHQFGFEPENTTFQPTNPLPTKTVGELATPVEPPVINRGYTGREWAQQDPVGYSNALNAHVEAAKVNPGIIDNIVNPVLREDVRQRLEGDKTVAAVSDYKPGAEPFSAEPVVSTPSDTAPAVGALSALPGFTDKMRHIRPMMETAAQIIEKFGHLPDIAQHIGQRFMNHVTKGSIYNGMRIDHPYYTKVTQRFRDADSNVQAAIRDLIHSKGAYADTLKQLSKKEYAGLSQEIQKAWREERPLTPDYLRAQGYSEKAITAAEAHKQFTDKLYNDYLKPAADLAGIKNVRQDISYFAGRTTGDFRHAILKDGEYVGTLAADTKWGLSKKVEMFKKLKEAEGTEIGPREYQGDKRRSDVSQGASQFGQWLHDNHPEMAGYVDVINKLNDDFTANYMGASKHTMEKKGTLGIQGADPTLGVHQNAKDFWNSQIQYGENVIKWAEKSKAMEDVKPLMETPGKPNLNNVIKQYVDNSMGRNPNAVGRALDSVEAAVGNLMGVSPNLLRNFAGGTKQAINIKLLALSPRFYWGNLTQSITRTPEMMSYLKTLGVDPSVLGSMELSNGLMDAVNARPKSQVVRDAEAYAQAHHVYSSDLFETTNRTRKGLGNALDKLTVPAAFVEQYTRKSFYLTAVDALQKHGMVGDELFGTAKNLTDMYMNNYAKEEGALSYNVLGKSGGSNAGNLMSFNNNEMSRLAMNINNAVKGDFKPLAVQLMSQVAMAGVMGVVGFKEADAIIKEMSKLAGKPISLSLLLSQSEGMHDIFKYGAPSYFSGFDLTSTGSGSVVQGLPGGNPMDVLMPGASAVVPPVKALMPILKDLAKGEKPKQFDMMNFGRELAPNGFAQGYFDRKLSNHTKSGEEIAVNRNTMKAQVQRTPTDKMAKNFGVTGLHEAMEKNNNFQLNDIDSFYKDKRQEAIKDWSRGVLTKNDADRKAAIADYYKNEGGNKLSSDLDKAVKDGFITEQMRKIMAAQAGDVPEAKSLMRRFAK